MFNFKLNYLIILACLASRDSFACIDISSTDHLAYISNLNSMREVDYKNEMLGIATAYLLSRALYTAAKLNVADYLSQTEPRHVAELAQELAVHQDSLYRLLRMLASHEIFKEITKNYFILTPRALCLTSYHASSIKDIILGEDDTRWNAVGSLDKAIQNGYPAFDQLYGKSYFEYITNKPALSAQFDAHMSQLTREEDFAILEALNLDISVKKLADIGGGRGSFLAKLLRKYIHVTGLLYDLPVVINNSQKLLLEDTQDRVELKAGSFFDEIPAGADAYILKRVLHDWNDDECRQILAQCKKAMNSASKLYVIDAVLPDDNSAHIGKDIDIFLMAIFSGKERTKTEFEELFASAGLSIKEIHATSSYISIIELELAITK